MLRLKIFLLLLFFVIKSQFAQQLVINEVSQGPTGAKEYVELLVVGTPTCNAIPCMDLRNYIIDDNNGNHATGTGVGIAAGCVRLQNIPFWQCIPYGTIIVFYNDADQNSSVPAPDLSMLDGNCRLIIPISNCTLLERHTTLPSSALSPYPTTGYVGCGNWTQISMANGDDSFQTINAAGTLVHSVSWGNNTLSTIIYFPVAAGGNVAIMTNTLNNNPAIQGNWAMSPVAGNETPGSPNNAANSAWINSMNNGCLPLLPLATTVTSTSAGCSCNGSANVLASGAIGPYTYTWFPTGGNTIVASGLCAGIYTVSATSSNGCVETKTVNIVSAGSISITIATTSATCNGFANGSATATPSGGTAPYSYTWSPSPGAGQGSSTVTGLSAQIYTITVSDNLGCTTLTTATITQPATALAAIPSATNILCFGAANGSASVTASGGTAGYTYTWSLSGGNTTLASLLTAGNYTVLVKDANNCTITVNTNVLQPVAPLSTIISATDVLCFGNNNGSAGVIANGGTPGYTYNWIPTGGTNSVANNLAPGNYTVIVKDINNCTINTFASISQPTAALGASVISSNIKCNGASNGSSTITATGGTAGYTFNWLPSLVSSSVNIGLGVGTHPAIVLDANNCTFSIIINIMQPPPITLNVNAIKLCSGQNGVLLGNVNGGTAPYFYTWNNNPGSFSVAVNTLANVIYTLSVTDSNGCNSPIDTAMVNVIPPLTLSVSPTKTICAGTPSSLNANASGGIGTYQYSWSPGSISGQVISVNIGNTTVYTVNVSDGCSQPAILTTTVYVETIPTPTLLVNKYSGCSPVCVSFTNTAFNPTLSIQNSLWAFSDGSFATGQYPNHCFSEPGVFTAFNSFTTTSGCVMIVEIKNHINVFQKPDANFSANDYSFDNSSPLVNFYNQSNATHYFWDFGGMGTSTLENPSYSFYEPNKYLVTLIAMNGFCSDTAYHTIECLSEFTFYAPNTFTPNDDKLNDFFLPYGQGWDIKTYSLMVFDRWGEKIFSANQPDTGWNGKFKEEEAKEDVYIWKASVKDIFGKQHSYAGHITLVK